MFGNTGEAINPQDVIAEYLSHASVQALVGPYVPSALFAQSVDKPFIMFETNTASCGGFPGISNSFAGALWSLDYGLQMAYTNFSEALLHMGGQSVMYNVSILSLVDVTPLTEMSTALHSAPHQCVLVLPMDRWSYILLHSYHG